MSLLSLLRSTGTLLRQTSTKDKVGPGASAAYAAVTGVQNVPCDVQPDGAAVEERLGQMVLMGKYAIYLSQDVGARASDLWQVGTRNFLIIDAGGYQAGGLAYQQWPAVLRAREVVFGP